MLNLSIVLGCCFDLVMSRSLGGLVIYAHVPQVAKRAGVKIPTACKTGICGTCTTDLEDPNGKSYRPGFQVVRACVTPVSLPQPLPYLISFSLVGLYLYWV